MEQFSIKYKSEVFSDLIGHEKIKKEFIKKSKDNSFPNVLFFIGEPGSGKTSCAAIIAKQLNCHNKNIENCQCNSCKDIREEKFHRDVLLYNASTMSKDDVNSIEDTVSRNPSYDENIIIIIDESQELSRSGKGSLKKLLEKKRENVYFILNTSDKDAFTPELKRRGQVYLFKEVNSLEIAEYLLGIVKKEDIVDKVPEIFIKEGIFTLAENCGGSPGYALSLLERCISGEIYSENEIVKELNLISEKVSSNLLFDMLNHDTSVFESLKNIELKEFFLKSFKILQEAAIYNVSGFVDQEWKISNAKRLSSNDFFNLLLEVFINTKNDVYFNERSFYTELIKYYNRSIPEIKRIESSEREPV